ncbi:MAG: restriction endonuclease, partial [Actinomycetota bacterium]|nr:restriction endonuclease [Actinomycetota bacterium]
MADEPEPSISTTTAGLLFERRIAELYRALGYDVKPNIGLYGQQVDLLAQRQVEGAGRITIAIECKDHARSLGNQVIQDFVATITSLRAADPSMVGVVVSASGFTQSARAVVQSVPFVTLLTVESLSGQLLDVAAATRDLTEHYQQLDIFETFVRLNARRTAWATQRADASGAIVVDVAKSLCDWITTDKYGTIFLLGDYGAGKSTILRRVQYDLARLYIDGDTPRIPLFVPLKLYAIERDLGTVLRASFRDQFYRDLPSHMMWRRISDGVFVLLLDGFDEMVERSDEERRLELFKALLPLFNSHSPCVLTSRPSYFVGRDELSSLLSELQRESAPLEVPIP